MEYSQFTQNQTKKTKCACVVGNMHTLRNVASMLEANALARSVFPVPGGP